MYKSILRFVPLFLIASPMIWSLIGCRPSEPAQGSAPVATGRFISKGGQETTGTFHIERMEGDLRLVLADDFTTDEGPDLHVVLTPVEVFTVSGENAMANGTAMVVGPLKTQSGAQRFDLPDDIDLDAFRSVLIHCIEFSHLYGAAPLR